MHIARRLLSSATATTADSLLTRQLPDIYDVLSPTPSNLLTLTLDPYLGRIRYNPRGTRRGPMRPGHYLVYFPPHISEDQLLPDGSDGQQSPGRPWVRRMWAGGSVNFLTKRTLWMGDRAILHERVEDIIPKGDDKLFVWFERRISSTKRGKESERICERRCLAFMKERPASEKQVAPRMLKPILTPEFTREFTPTEHLLFRFSALTFNAHKIHLDSDFTKNQEGYPGNLCHGPLAQIFLLELLQREVVDKTKGKRIKTFEYKCLAPMYVGERYKIAGCRVGEDTVELWAETPDGGYSVKGVAHLINSDREKNPNEAEENNEESK